MAKQIYRGYDIEAKDGKWIVSLNGKTIASAPSESAAQDFIDIERRKAREAMGT